MGIETDQATQTNIEADVVDFLAGAAKTRGRSFFLEMKDASFFDQGILDSLSLLDFVAYLEKRFDLEIPGTDILPENFGSLNAVVRYLSKRVRATS